MTDPAPAAPASKPEKTDKVSLAGFAAINQAVREQVDSKLDTVRQAIVDDLAKEDLEARKTLVKEGLRQLPERKGAMEKARKTGTKQYVGDQEVLSQTPEQRKEKLKAEKAYNDLEAALNAAFPAKGDPANPSVAPAKPNYDPLKKALGKVKPEEGEKKDGEEKAAE